MYLPKFQIQQIQSGSLFDEKIKPNITPMNALEQKEGIQLSVQARQFLLPSFVMGIFGGPGAGKSSFIVHLLKAPQLYAKKFERVIFIGPTKYKGLVQDNFNTSPKFDIDWIYKHINEAKQWQCMNMLIIFDDIISSLAKTTDNKLIDLFFNRRHLLKNNKGSGTISIILTSQKFNLVPVYMRGTINAMIIFPLMKQQLSVLYSETNITMPKKKFMELFGDIKRHQYIYLNIQHNKAYNHEWIQI